MLNVITGVFVESALRRAHEDKDALMIENVREIFLNIKGDMDGKLTLANFEKQAEASAMLEYFKAIDVDPSEARGLFRLLDRDGSDTIDAEEFFCGCLRLRGPAKALDLALVEHQVKELSRNFQRHAALVAELLLSGPPGAHQVGAGQGPRGPAAAVDRHYSFPPNGCDPHGSQIETLMLAEGRDPLQAQCYPAGEDEDDGNVSMTPSEEMQLRILQEAAWEK